MVAALIVAKRRRNLVFFRLTECCDGAFWFYVPYICSGSLSYGYCGCDKVSATLLFIYTAYLPYASSGRTFVLKLNSDHRKRDRQNNLELEAPSGCSAC